MEPWEINYAQPGSPMVMGASNPQAAYIQGVTGGGGAPSVGQQTPSSGFGANLGTAQLALSGLQSIGSIWGAYEANKLAKQQLAFQKEVWNTNLANQIKSYNTNMSDRINARSFVEGRPEGYSQQYLDENKLTR